MTEGDSKDWSFTSHVGEDLRGADLSGANLRRAILDRSDLEGADLSGADLRNASLKGANLMKAALDGADLRGARMVKARLGLSNLQGARLDGADMRGIRGKYAVWRGATGGMRRWTSRLVRHYRRSGLESSHEDSILARQSLIQSGTAVLLFTSFMSVQTVTWLAVQQSVPCWFLNS